MRLIDADIMMELVGRLPFRNNEDIKNFIEVQPTVDAVEVVRCKECKWYRGFGEGWSKCCTKLEWVHKEPEDYCSWGERDDSEEREKHRQWLIGGTDETDKE